MTYGEIGFLKPLTIIIEIDVQSIGRKNALAKNALLKAKTSSEIKSGW